jgi:hypothetical protein
MADTLTSTIELLTESMTNTIDNAIAQFEEKLTGAYGSLERLSEAFD